MVLAVDTFVDVDYVLFTMYCSLCIVQYVLWIMTLFSLTLSGDNCLQKRLLLKFTILLELPEP